MSSHAELIRKAFQKPHCFPVKLTPKGFLADDELLTSLSGRVARTQLIRKLFEDGVLVCYSNDGLTSRDGSDCDRCGHPRCQPQLRLHLHDGNVRYIIDLAATSARNFLAIDDQARSRGHNLDDWDLTLTVHDHGRWGEVRFHRGLEQP